MVEPNPPSPQLGERVRETLVKAFTEFLENVSYELGQIVGSGAIGFLDKLEERYPNLLSSLITKIMGLPECPAEVRSLLKEAIEPTSAVGATLAWAAGSQAMGATIMSFLNPILLPLSYAVNLLYPPRIPEPGQLVICRYRGLLTDQEYETHMKRHGFFPEAARDILNSGRPLLDLDALKNLYLREEIDKPTWQKAMAAHGLTDDDIQKLSKLYWIIPSAPDLIRMAVREVFTPDIVEYFGQMQDFPSEFASWGKKVGLTEEWAKYYWAAHWDLPSIMQGFEMLHRTVRTPLIPDIAPVGEDKDGAYYPVIDEKTLRTLLRALDVMPFWRDKLIAISYRPFTRVDVRRMYRVGVLDRDGVKRAYLDLGYDSEKAEAMTDFTVKYETTKERDLTRSDILDGYRRDLIDRDTAIEYLTDLGYSRDEANFYLDREDLKKTQSIIDDYIDIYRRQYLEGVISLSEAEAKLKELTIPDERITELLDLWVAQKEAKGLPLALAGERDLTKADILDGYKKAIITKQVASDYLSQMGYDPTEVEFLLQKTDYTKEKEKRDLSLSTYRKLYTLGIMDKTSVTAALAEQKFAKEELEYLYTLWDIEKVGTVTIPTRADLARFLKKGIIDERRYREEMKKRGYTDEYIDWYLMDLSE